MLNLRSILCFIFSTAIAAHGEQFRQFWLTEAVSGRTVGPITARPGNKFDCGGEKWVILKTDRPGEIDFADMKTLTRQGPYDLVEQRLIDLGPKAYVFVKVADFDGDDPAADRSVVSQAVRERVPDGTGYPRETGRHEWSGELPERWVLGPLPSTNPRAHKDYAAPWSMSTVHFAPSVMGFIDVSRSVQYDWELGGLSGGKKKAIESKRFGVKGEWNGFSGEFGLSTGAKTKGSIVSDGVSLSSLGFSGGDGFFASAGYDWRFRIEGGWSASIGGRASWERISGHLSANTTKQQTSYAIDESTGTTNSVSSFGFGAWSQDSTLSEIRVTAAASIRYDEWYWGLNAAFLVDCVADTSISSGDVPVMGRTYSLEADRSQPVGLVFGFWYSPCDNWSGEVSLSIGSEKTLRLAAGWFF
jgi:hypothetical protein